MQTKPKQKLTAILIAFTMILTTMLQLFIPITVHAEESRTISLNKEIIYTDKNDNEVTYIRRYDFVGNGNFVIKCFLSPSSDGVSYDLNPFIFSDKYFTLQIYDNGNLIATNKSTLKNYYYSSFGGFAGIKDLTHNPFSSCTTVLDSTAEYQTIYNQISNGTYEIDLSKDDYEEKPSWIELDKNGTYSEDIPTPKIKVSSNLDYTFENGQSDYFYEVKGRWRSIDNITVNNYNQILSKGQIYYKTILKGDLLWWITANDKKSILETGNLTDIGHDSFYDFITKHPVDSRTIVASGNGFYNPFDETIPIDSVKTSLKIQNSAMNSFEIYIRYYKIDDSGNYIYGKWSHYYNNLIDNGFTGKFIRDYWDGIEDTHYQSQNGLTKEELENVENLDDSLNDSDITTITNPNDTLDSDLDFSKLTKVLMSLYNQAKTIFSMYGTVFNFLPDWVINIISVSFVIVCFVGIWKVIR